MINAVFILQAKCSKYSIIFQNFELEFRIFAYRHIFCCGIKLYVGAQFIFSGFGAIAKKCCTGYYIRCPKNYTMHAELIDIETLALRRSNVMVFFVFDLLACLINAPNILKQLNFNVPVRILRDHNFFGVSLQRTNYGGFSTVYR